METIESDVDLTEIIDEEAIRRIAVNTRYMLQLTMKRIAITVMMLFCLSTAAVAAAESSFTQSDRDRMIRLEEGLKATNQRINDVKAEMNSIKADVKAEMNSMKADMKADMNSMKADINIRLEQMTTFMLWGFGILFSGMGFLMGFVLWDRRTALAPAIRKTKELEERAELLEKALKEASITNPGIKEALKHVGIL
jgi:glutamine synthetase type III